MTGMRNSQVWNLPAALEAADAEGVSKPTQMLVTAAVAAHDKDINAVAVSPNDALVVTASQDRTAKVWTLLGPHAADAHRTALPRCVVTWETCTAFMSLSVLQPGSCIRPTSALDLPELMPDYQSTVHSKAAPLQPLQCATASAVAGRLTLPA